MGGSDHRQPTTSRRTILLATIVAVVAIAAAVIRIIDPDPIQQSRQQTAAKPAPQQKLPESTTFYARTAIRELDTGATVRWTDIQVEGRALPAYRLCQALVRQLIWSDKGEDLANTTFARQTARACGPARLPKSLPGLTEVGGSWSLVEGLSTDPVELAWRSRDPAEPRMATELPLLKALRVARSQPKAEDLGHPDGMTAVIILRNTRYPAKQACAAALSTRQRNAQGARAEVDRRWLDEAIGVHQDWVSEACPAEGTPGPCEVHRRILELLVARRKNPPETAPVRAPTCRAL